MKETYDVLIVTTAKDFLRLRSNYRRLITFMEERRLLFVGSDEVGEHVAASGFGDRAGFLNENDVLLFDDVHALMKKLLGSEDVPRRMTGWYYQQFLKMQYAFLGKDEYYLVWDGDTIPCKPFSMFQTQLQLPYLDMKNEYHEEYFVTLGRLFPGMHKMVGKSFISEHMLINCRIMKELIQELLASERLTGDSFCERILRAITPQKLTENSFSEFETYGTYVACRHPEAYRLRNWHSFRYGASFFDPEKITDSDYAWLARDFDAISFEKNQSVRDDHKDIFTKKEYQEKLSARQILQIAQDTFEEGYLEVWED